MSAPSTPAISKAPDGSTSAQGAPRPYRVDHPLAKGITLLEASAGTGKTYQITNLVLRLVLEEKVRMREILVVTFTRAATAELKDRVRRRLAAAARAFREGRCDDPTIAAMVEQARRAGTTGDSTRLLVEAQESFDQASIQTIHGFCQTMLQQNAFESALDFGTNLSETDDLLVQELVDDSLSKEVNTAELDRHIFLADECGFTRESLLGLARMGLQDPTMPLTPSAEPAPWADDAREAADKLNNGGLDELATAFGDAAATGRFAPKRGGKSQTKYTEKRCRKELCSLLEWLGGDGEEPQPTKEYLSEKAMAPYTPPGREVFQHPLLDRLRSLLAPRDRLIAWERARFVQWVRHEFARRNDLHRTMCFQDLLRLLAESLRDPARRDLLQAAIAPRFTGVLIDEFQDTDPEQWAIFRTLFGGGAHFLYLIGDPKQAIYGFRGANVNVYLAARGLARGRIFSMRTNFRSDGPLLEGLNTLMSAPHKPGEHPPPATARASMFGLEGICYESVEPNPERDPPVGLEPPVTADPSLAAPLQIRCLDIQSDTKKLPARGALTSAMARRVAADVADLLGRGFRIHREPKHPAPLAPGHIAVLVRTGRQGRMIQEALSRVKVPSVLSGAESVFSSDEAEALLRWLQAVASPSSERLARRAAVSHLFGHTASQLLALDSPQADKEWWDTWLSHIAWWRTLIEKKGALFAFRQAMACHDVERRLLTLPEGERRLTNLLHLLELLHEAEVTGHLRMEALLRWLSEGRIDARKVDRETAELRLETDDDAVRILTMHKAKGLQFPVVFAPYLWDGGPGKTSDGPIIVSASDGSPERILDLNGDEDVEPRKSNLRRYERESMQDAMRLLYVAITRAEHRAVIYTGPVQRLDASPLGVLLHAFEWGEDPAEVGDRLTAPMAREFNNSRDAMEADLNLIQEAAGDLVHISWCEDVRNREITPWARPEGAKAEAIETAIFNRTGPDGAPTGLDLQWQRLSYSGFKVTRRHHGPPAQAGAEAEQDPELLDGRDLDQEVDHDEAEAQGAVPEPADPDPAEDVPLAPFPAGAEAGTFLHDLFEHMDFQAFGGDMAEERGRQELDRVLDERGPRHGFTSPRWRDCLHGGLPQVLRTPLGGALGSMCLADIPRSQRLDELQFDLPVAGGLLHRGVDHDRNVGWPEKLSGEDLGRAFLLGRGGPVLRDAYLQGLVSGWTGQRFAGYLTGSIDLVFATGEGDSMRFWIADYKSNKLDLDRERRHPPEHFRHERMLTEMENHDYVVQYHLYTVALHRYLRQRLGERYDYHQHVGGAFYLFIRGMLGPSTPLDGPHPYGVFFDKPRLEVIQRLDDVLEGAVEVSP